MVVDPLRFFIAPLPAKASSFARKAAPCLLTVFALIAPVAAGDPAGGPAVVPTDFSPPSLGDLQEPVDELADRGVPYGGNVDYKFAPGCGESRAGAEMKVTGADEIPMEQLTFNKFVDKNTALGNHKEYHIKVCRSRTTFHHNGDGQGCCPAGDYYVWYYGFVIKQSQNNGFRVLEENDCDGQFYNGCYINEGRDKVTWAQWLRVLPKNSNARILGDGMASQCDPSRPSGTTQKGFDVGITIDKIGFNIGASWTEPLGLCWAHYRDTSQEVFWRGIAHDVRPETASPGFAVATMVPKYFIDAGGQKQCTKVAQISWTAGVRFYRKSDEKLDRSDDATEHVRSYPMPPCAV